ncbi:amidohydrolase family protein [Rhodoferax sp. GW822-FHT02A01]|uniref:amidohydrolase family protein n=1 Tax=Rhodoferax sp. GW822-FHT02A01 TaxID=3141537 RepID=UPI00315D2FC6
MLNSSTSLPPPTSYAAVKFRLPLGSCDSHTHVIPASGVRLVPSATYTPAVATVQDHLSMLEALGLDRGVVVQPSIFGVDNSAVIEAVATAPDRLRGVGVLGATATWSDVEYLHERGVRGLRFNVMLGGGDGLQSMKALAPIIAEFGWHAELLIASQLLPDLVDDFKSLPCRLVVDHMGSLGVDEGMNSKGVTALRRLVSERETWVKLSGAYRLGADIQDDRFALRARTLIHDAPQHMVWGSDWPHVACSVMPDAAELLNALGNWLEADAKLLKAVLADNPAKLFDFSSTIESKGAQAALL